jgi:drug/metabolite transporter (DMT)-like permease
MPPPDWLWIPITIWAAFAQTLRNAAQRHLTGELGTFGATLVRFLYGLPFAAAWLFAVHVAGALPMPAPNAAFAGWVTLGAISQVTATAFLLRVMAERNFALGVAYSKSEILQVALFGLLFLGDPITAVTALAVAFGTAGVLLLSPADPRRPLRALVLGWTTRPALLGVGCGTALAFSVIGFRGAALALEGAQFVMAAAYTLVVAQALQSVVMVGWLLIRSRAVLARVLQAWRPSLFAGFMGAAASAGWFTAMAIEPAAHVRTLGLIELLFSYVISRRVFRERLSRLEIGGLGLLTMGVVIITLQR